MAYAATNPPAKVTQTIAGKSLWIYTSVDDDATVNGAGYFTNGVALGMQAGDFVLVWDTTTPKGSFHYVASINTTTGTATTAFGAVA